MSTIAQLCFEISLPILTIGIHEFTYRRWHRSYNRIKVWFYLSAITGVAVGTTLHVIPEWVGIPAGLVLAAAYLLTRGPNDDGGGGPSRRKTLREVVQDSRAAVALR